MMSGSSMMVRCVNVGKEFRQFATDYMRNKRSSRARNAIVQTLSSGMKSGKEKRVMHGQQTEVQQASVFG